MTPEAPKAEIPAPVSLSAPPFPAPQASDVPSTRPSGSEVRDRGASTWMTPNLLLAVTTGLLLPAVIAVVYFIAQSQETRRTVEELRVTVHEIELEQERNMAVVRKWEACLHKEEVTR